MKSMEMKRMEHTNTTNPIEKQGIGTMQTATVKSSTMLDTQTGDYQKFLNS